MAAPTTRTRILTSPSRPAKKLPSDGSNAPSYSSLMRIRIIDAFTDRPFAGNPAGVCLLDAGPWPDTEWMRRIAAELSHETAFAHPLPDGADADWALVVADVADEPHGLATFLLESPGGDPVPALDVTRKVARVNLDGRRARRIGPEGDQSGIWRRVLDDLNVALCAELVGTSERALDLAVEYAKVRVQFDRPIATFQVIKHKAADMLHRLELARVGTHFAAWASDAEDPGRERAAAMCKGYVAEAADQVTAESIQIHGGVGFTWDVDCHLLYRRAKQDDLLFGAQGFERRRLAELLLGPADS